MIEQPALTPLKEVPPPKVIAEMLKTFKATDFFHPDEIEWLESIITRPDGVSGFDTLTGSFGNLRNPAADLLELCEQYNAEKRKLSYTSMYRRKLAARNLLWSKRVSMYVQKRVLILAPQRKQHAKYPAPHLDGFPGGGQSHSASIITSYGLNYVEARNTLVRQALADPNCSHVFFVDDDVLIPQDALKRLLDYQLPIVAGLYPKKTPALESNVTTSGPDAELIFGQKEVPLEVGNMTPVPASCCGGGMLLISTDVFRAMPEPWFDLIGKDGRVAIGEDSYFVQRAAENGFKTYAVPGIIGVHVDFKTGDCYAPHEIVDPVTRRIRPEYVERYQRWPKDLNLADLAAADVVDWFGKNKQAEASK